MKKLTTAAVERLKPLAGRIREIPDAGAAGLRLCIYPSGKKSWVMRFRRPSGDQTKLTLGPLSTAAKGALPTPLTIKDSIGKPMTIREARAVAGLVNDARSHGIDVAAQCAEWRKTRDASPDEPTTFPAVARRFCEEHALLNRSGRENTARLLGLIYPKSWSKTDGGEPKIIAGSLSDRWRKRSVAEIGVGDIDGVIKESSRSGIPGIQVQRSKRKGEYPSRGRALASALSKMFSFAVVRGLAPTNPCRGMKPRAAEPRRRRLTDDEVVTLWPALDTFPFGTIARLLLLTGQRRSEVSGMRWSELSGDSWTLPAERTKNGEEHTITLPPAAQEIIKSVPRIAGRDLLFSTTGKTAVSGWSKSKRQIDRAAGPLPPWTIHDLRRSAASGMQKLGVRIEVIEKVLNHMSGSFGGVAGIYQRDPMTEETKAALALWAAHVVSVVEAEPARVVPLRKASR